MPTPESAELEQQPEPAQALVGTTFAERYRIEALLGVGGMGAVYRAVHLTMQKTVALKLLHPEMIAVPEVLARFEREAVAAARVTHPNIASAIDFGKLPDGSPYLVMEFIPGRALRDALTGAALPPERALRIALQIAHALVAAHAAGIVHRDLKPENVMLRSDGGEEQVKILDLGIAKVPVDETRGGKALTKIGAVLGTPQYMAPEQAIGGKVDHRSDLYALGVVLYEMASGAPPFSDDDGAHAVIARHLTEPPPTLPASVPEALASLIMQLLAKSAGMRPQSAAEVVRRLQEVSVRALPQPTAAVESDEPPRRRRRPLAFAAAALVLVVFGVWLAKTLTAVQGDAAVAADGVTSPSVVGAAAMVVPELPPRPEPSSTSAAEAAPSEARSPAPKPSKPARGKGKKKERKTGPGGIYVPPPEDWF